MKALCQIFNFLGGIFLAIGLIVVVACVVLAGTFLEAHSDSHRYASQYTYAHPLFKGLLFLFFINILFAALRRWPFKKKHFPFLITHLGLLMMLSGVIYKSFFGVQGSMGVLEGGASDKILVKDSYVFRLESRDPQSPNKRFIHDYDLSCDAFGNFNPQVSDGSGPFPDLNIQLAAFYPHSNEDHQYWIKGEKLFVQGFPILDVYDLGREGFPEPFEFEWEGGVGVWDLWALRGDDVTEIIKQVFLFGSRLQLRRNRDSKVLLDTDMESAINEGFIVDGKGGMIHLNLQASMEEGLVMAKLSAFLDGEEISIPLKGPEALLNNPYEENPAICIDIIRRPALAFIENYYGDQFIFAVSSCGEVYLQSFLKGGIENFIVYDKGYEGYAIQTDFPVLTVPNSRRDRENAKFYRLTMEIRQVMAEGEGLTKSLEAFKQACEEEGQDFLELWLILIEQFSRGVAKVEPKALKRVLERMDLVEMNSLLNNFLPNMGRQFTAALSALDEEVPSLLDAFTTMKLFKISVDSLLEDDGLETNRDKAEYLKSIEEQSLRFKEAKKIYQRMCRQIEQEAIDLNPERLADIYQFVAPIIVGKSGKKEIKHLEDALIPRLSIIETSLGRENVELPPSKKLEDNTPKIVLALEENGKREIVEMTYDPFAIGLKWPLLGGKYLGRYQPRFETIPYRLRLRDTRQVNYPNSQQAYSYESDILITEKSTNHEWERRISMNNVYETWDGYRFYMASISPPNEVSAQRARIVVNLDPAKYYLTYPGAMILLVGMIALLWCRRLK